MFSVLGPLFILGGVLAVEPPMRPNYKHNNPNLSSKNPNHYTMIQMFEWTWKDIADECPFLAKYGYGAIQISPPTDHIRINREVGPKGTPDAPWYIRYQPISYLLHSRSGDEKELQNMIDTCNKHGVRIIVDIVLNHMASPFSPNGKVNSWSRQTEYDTQNANFSHESTQFTKEHFNDHQCPTDNGSIDDYNNAIQVRNCRLESLADLNQGHEHVRSKMAALLNKLIEMGVAGFRFDASKHMWPGDLQIIIDRLEPLREDLFGKNKNAFIVHEVIDKGTEPIKMEDYMTPGLGRGLNFAYGLAMGDAMENHNMKNFASLVEMYEGTNTFRYGHNVSSAHHNIVNFLCNHDNQRYERDHMIMHDKTELYKLGNAYMLAWSYGYARTTSPKRNLAGGPCDRESNKGHPDMPDGRPGYGWVCEHRWWPIAHMTLWRSQVGAAAVAAIFQHHDNRTLGFARLGKGYFAGNNSDHTVEMGHKVFTTLPEGKYCNVFTDNAEVKKKSSKPWWRNILAKPGVETCTDKTIVVNSTGHAKIEIPARSAIAINLESRIGGVPKVTSEDTKGMVRTVIFLKHNPGLANHVFIRGGKKGSGASIKIYHNAPVPTAYSDKWMIYEHFGDWRQGNNQLSWKEFPQTQGTHD